MGLFRSEALWKLDDTGHPVKCPDLMEWARWRETADPHIAETFTEHFRISTVFLGINHNFFRRRSLPILYETMVFDNQPHDRVGLDGRMRAVHEELDGHSWRYASRDDALAGHHSTVKRIVKLEADAARLAPHGAAGRPVDSVGAGSAGRSSRRGTGKKNRDAKAPVEVKETAETDPKIGQSSVRQRCTRGNL